MSDKDALEALATELIAAFEITSPPVPVESMLNNPKEGIGMWQSVDMSRLSGSFMSLKSLYSPRVSIARMLARHVMASEWGKTRNTETLLNGKEALQTFARMLLMPKDMVTGLTRSGRNPTTMSIQFEVPEDDARVRLQEIFGEAQ